MDEYQFTDYKDPPTKWTFDLAGQSVDLLTEGEKKVFWRRRTKDRRAAHAYIIKRLLKRQHRHLRWLAELTTGDRPRLETVYERVTQLHFGALALAYFGQLDLNDVNNFLLGSRSQTYLPPEALRKEVAAVVMKREFKKLVAECMQAIVIAFTALHEGYASDSFRLAPLYEPLKRNMILVRDMARLTVYHPKRFDDQVRRIERKLWGVR